MEETTMEHNGTDQAGPRCPACGGSLRELPEDQWPEGGPVPDGTERMFLCERTNHRIIVAVPEISG